jgi:hypothetical protein
MKKATMEFNLEELKIITKVLGTEVDKVTAKRFINRKGREEVSRLDRLNRKIIIACDGLSKY